MMSVMAKEIETTNPLCLPRLKDSGHSKRTLFLIGIQVVLPFIFLLKCSQDTVKGLMTPQGHSLFRGLKDILSGVQKLISQKRQMKKE